MAMNAVPSADRSIARIATRPTPQRRVAREAATAPMNADAPPIAGHDADRRRSELQLLEDEQEPDRPEDAPRDRMRHLGADERPQDGIAADDADPVPDLVEDRLAIGDRRRRCLLSPDRAEEQRRDQELTSHRWRS